MTESKNPRRLPLLVLLAGVAAVIVAAVLLQRGDEAPAPAEQNTLHRGIGSDPDSFDQHKTNALQSFAVLRDLGEGLVAYDRHGLLIPGVAESQVMMPMASNLTDADIRALAAYYAGLEGLETTEK